jgi:hypothetical protein
VAEHLPSSVVDGLVELVTWTALVVDTAAGGIWHMNEQWPEKLRGAGNPTVLCQGRKDFLVLSAKYDGDDGTKLYE